MYSPRSLFVAEATSSIIVLAFAATHIALILVLLLIFVLLPILVLLLIVILHIFHGLNRCAIVVSGVLLTSDFFIGLLVFGLLGFLYRLVFILVLHGLIVFCE